MGSNRASSFIGTNLSGTMIIVKKLQRAWSPKMIESIQRNILALKSPFKDLSDFDIQMKIEDEVSPPVSIPDWNEIINKATYTFTGEINRSGKMKYHYRFKRPDLPDLNQSSNKEFDIRDPEEFSGDREPVCGPFDLRFYSWDLSVQESKGSFW